MRKTIGFLLAIAFLFALPLQCRALGLKRVHVEEKMICLTFDDGPHPRYTREILDILATYDIKATFFMIGENAGYYAETAKMVAEQGHEIGNHSMTHPKFSTLEPEKLEEEIRRAEEAIQLHTGVKTTLFRPPQGYLTAESEQQILELGYTPVLWSVDPRDWESGEVSAIAESVRKKASSGDIILFHDYVSGKYKTASALKKIIPHLLDAGYRFVTVSELMNYQEEVAKG